MAISPDHGKLALTYGVFRSYDGIAFVGLYSLTDGRRLATLRGDTYRGGVWHAIFHNTEEVWAQSAPVNGALTFSPDLRVLLATSANIYQWDVSGLH
jgi:hypothetical protein